MYVPMPFPYCDRCGKQWGGNAVHTDCGGDLELDPDNRRIRCKSCYKSWNLRESVFHCPHNHTFEASEVEDAVDDLVEDCKLAAEEIAIMRQSFSNRKAMSYDSQRAFARDTLNSMSYSISKMAGYVFEKLVDFVLDLVKGFIFR